ncbi:arginase [Rhizobium ruizarguesonis]|jgi:arginase|uniref:Arginase n=1 Tax=Rhizobium ruizarguesonis TaxID=2081791 RepID=A0AB38I8U6_9HYPH|nr:arginase [Rhizobium ruizarguesonis]NEI04775.1 arginase [Rhizobium ruizarguesonis]NEI27570.1 arginase [Rhizobium ruizarguesonis]TAY95955.1 arginase [Rhizobium ruizarguesonis]TAZ80338.1 arginase [Rhizobium ruizarguesonis]TBA06723.1 arginase [Rhizobium ruizarguesonis]
MDAQSRSVTLIGAPLEEGSGRRGAAMGPAALRIAGVDQTLIELGHDVADIGDLRIVPAMDLPNHPKAHNLRIVGAFTRALESSVHDVAASGRFPLILGGDHSLSMGSVSGMARYAASKGRPLFVLWLDAHADFNSPATSPSGNIHGMPVAFFCGEAEFAAILPKDRPFVDPKNVFQVGIRSVDAREREEIHEHGVNVFDMRAIDEQGIGAIMREILDVVTKANGLLHVSLDLDFLDPEIAPGVGTTVPGGATFREAHLVMEMLSDSGLVSSLDLVELNPFLDDRGKSARILVELTASLFGRRIFDRPTRAA